MPQYNITFDWNRISTLGKVKVLVEQVVGQPSQEAVDTAIDNWMDEHSGSTATVMYVSGKTLVIESNGGQ